MFKFNFDKARALLFAGAFTQIQVDSINAIMREINDQGITASGQAAYIFATGYHECFDPKNPRTRLTPMTELGGEKYLKGKKYWPYIGRGFVQITWRANYDKYRALILEKYGVDIIAYPEALLNPQIAAFIIVHGMRTGMFTGAKLSTYINDRKVDFKNARRIVNGTDKADLIAGYASQFLKCIDHD